MFKNDRTFNNARKIVLLFVCDDSLWRGGGTPEVPDTTGLSEFLSDEGPPWATSFWRPGLARLEEDAAPACGVGTLNSSAWSLGESTSTHVRGTSSIISRDSLCNNLQVADSIL
ncbi:Lactate utilization protein C [Frankliniella fusca]|uniref:Lactate utilization protein C n=1 Tax=Frankliniella fusca TaxID=407009 RepID=A0AAE1H7S5_9NEOP|nr:Lactate utilization protein C [Frankliniella fusca]